MTNNQTILYCALMNQNPTNGVRERLDNILKIIPEIKSMIGFNHKHPHHHLDVWEHTLLALSVTPNDFEIRLAILLHDIGKPHCFIEQNGVRHFYGHPKRSAQISKIILDRLEYTDEFIDTVCKIILLHDDKITPELAIDKPSLAKKIFEVQKCDVFAHNPEKNKKRLEYIKTTTQIFNYTKN